jgi:bifunctional DNA-binding transcriptional regulator/antitoxin component of YhaV-PrlF toxin-antitoxin module
MEQMHMRVIGRCFGTAVLGPRGQLVVPAQARKELGIDTRSKLLVFSHLGGRGLILIKAEAAEELLNMVSSRLDEVARLVKKGKATDAGAKRKGKPN